MKVISIYELLGLIKDGKAPKKIKYFGGLWLVRRKYVYIIFANCYIRDSYYIGNNWNYI